MSRFTLTAENRFSFRETSHVTKLRYLGTLFYILCSHFHENKNGGTTLPGGRVSRQSQRVKGGLMQPFQFLENRKFAILKNICILWCWNLQITISLLYKQKTRWNSDIQNFYSEIWIFAYFTPKKSQFSSILRSGMSLWRHNYVTPWPTTHFGMYG